MWFQRISSVHRPLRARCGVYAEMLLAGLTESAQWRSVQPRTWGLLASLLVALIWGSSLVLTKQLLPVAKPMTIAGLRYSLGAVILLPFVIKATHSSKTAVDWFGIAVVGLAGFGLGNTALFAAVEHLPATTASFALSLLPIIVLPTGWVWLDELPTRKQLLGLAVASCGVVLFFLRGLDGGPWLAVILLVLGVGAHAFRSVLGKRMLTTGRVGPMSLAAYPLAIGGAMTLSATLVSNGVPKLSLPAWALILWLAAVNTAGGYALFNFALNLLPAFEVNLILNLTPFVTALIAWWYAGEGLAGVEVLGLLVGVAGIALVQLHRGEG